MNIELKKLTPKSPDIKKVKSLYLSAFPKEERAPFSVIKGRLKRDSVDLFSIYSDNEWAGFIYIVSSEALSYAFFFAIDDSRRGQGIGSAALQKLKEMYSDKTFFLAIEELDEKYDNYAQRLGRKAFYERNGLHLLDTKIVEAGVIYDLMGFGEKITPDAYKKLMTSYLGKIYSKLVKTYVL